MNEFIDLFDSSEKLDLEPAKLIEALLSLEPSGQIYLDCSGAKTRSGISKWLGVRIIEGIEKESMAMPGKPTPLTRPSVIDLKGRISDHESGLSLLKGLEVIIKTDWGAKSKILHDDQGKPLLDKDGGLIEEALTDEEIKANRLIIDFVIRFTGKVHSTGFRPPNPSILLSGYDLERVTNVLNQRQDSNTPPGVGDFDKGPYPESDTQTRGKGQNFFSEKFSNLRTPHALYIAGLDTSKISGVSAWKNFKQLAKESAGIRSEEYHGLPPVYLKFNPRDPKNSVLYKYSSFEGSRDFGDGEISSTAFLEAYRRAKKASNPT